MSAFRKCSQKCKALFCLFCAILVGMRKKDLKLTVMSLMTMTALFAMSSCANASNRVSEDHTAVSSAIAAESSLEASDSAEKESGDDSSRAEEESAAELEAAGAGGVEQSAFRYELSGAAEEMTKASPFAGAGQTSAIDENAMTGPLYTAQPVVVGKAPGEPSSGSLGNAAKAQEGKKLSAMQAEIPTAAAVSVQNYDGSTTDVVPEPTVPLEKLVWNSCTIEGADVVLRASMTGSFTPSNTKMGEDTNFYLLELKPYEDDIAGHRYVAALPKNQDDLSFKLPLNNGSSESRLYNKFVACIWDGTKYIQVSDPVYINNPEAAAKYKDAYKEPLSKKGLLIDLSQVADAFELGVHNVIVNIPYNAVFGEGIDYTFEGETYHFNKSVIEAYDKTISMFSNKQMNVNVILLNGWNDATPDFYYPGTAKTSAAAYYHFNSKTEQGYKDIKAIASFLAGRYSGQDPNHGRVQNWVIGNEVNNQYWNYIGAMDLNSYVNEFARTFRVFYNAIKSTCANSRVFFSVDYNWMREANGSTKYNAKEFLDRFAAKTRTEGNIDWGLAYHPYSYPMTEPEFWDDAQTGLVSYSNTSPIVNFANLSVLTDYMQRSEMRDRNGSVRHIILSEEGFTSQSATRGAVEELQAAAFAYAYYIVDSNPYIDAFIMSRQIDAPSEVKQSMAFGLWTTDQTEDVSIMPAKRKYIWPVFKNIDRQQDTLEATAFAKKILGINKWSDIIPNFKWARFE